MQSSKSTLTILYSGDTIIFHFKYVKTETEWADKHAADELVYHRTLAHYKIRDCQSQNLNSDNVIPEPWLLLSPEQKHSSQNYLLLFFFDGPIF